MISFFRKLWKSKRGNALVVAGACLPMIVGAAGLASDTIQWTLWKRQLQRAADSAAIAGVYDRQANNGGTANVATAVAHDLTLNLHTWMALNANPTVGTPADLANGTQTNRVNVSLSIQQRLPFSSLFMSAAPIITANASAASVPAGGDACFDARDPVALRAFNITGNAGIEAPDCIINSNSSSSNSAAAGGSSNVIAKAVSSVGGIQQSNNWHVSAYRPYSPPIADPFAAVNPVSSDMKCAGHWETTGHGVNQTTSWVYDALSDSTDMANAVAQDGSHANCWTSMLVQSNTTLTPPANFGPIYINGGGADIRGNFSCTHCTIVLTNSDPSTTATIGQLTVNASSNINITAPNGATDRFKGIAIYQDRRAPDSTTKNKINGNSGSVIVGAIYFPSQEVDYNGTGNTSAVCTMFIARRLTFSGNSGTTNKFKSMSQCAVEGLPGGGGTRLIRLVA
jgi:Flp pilus assembly protein TadG